MLSAGAAQSPQPVPAVTAAVSPALTQGISHHVSPALPGRSTRGNQSGTSAAGSPAPIGEIQGDPIVSAAGSKRKADQLQLDEPFQVILLVLQCCVAVDDTQ